MNDFKFDSKLKSFQIQEEFEMKSSSVGTSVFKKKIADKKHPYPTVDAIIKYYDKGKFKGIVLVNRKYAPFGWALPGGFVNYNESVEKAVKREAKEETGLTIKKIDFVGVYSDPRRDKRLHTITTVFLCKASGKIKAHDDAKGIGVFSLNKIPKLCFDHGKIIKNHLKEIRKY